MFQPTRRALRATAAFAGLATAFGMGGTAFAATAATPHLDRGPSGTAPADAGAGLPGMSAPTAAPGPDDLHAFALPSTAPASHSSHHSKHADDGGGPEEQSGATHYEKHGGKQGYATDRSSDKYLKHAEANRHYGDRKCSSSPTVYGFGYNGEGRGGDEPSSDDYRPSCDGYHAPKGANNYDNDGYVGTDDSRYGKGGKSNYQFGGLL